MLQAVSYADSYRYVCWVQVLPSTGPDGYLAGHPVWNVRAVRIP